MILDQCIGTMASLMFSATVVSVAFHVSYTVKMLLTCISSIPYTYFRLDLHVCGHYPSSLYRQVFF